MKARQRRVRALELSLTPQQVVVVWLRNAIQAGTFEDGARHSPPYRSAVANAVRDVVRNSMRDQDETLIERAVVQARQEADLLYNLAVAVNVEVIESRVQREREYILLLGWLSAELLVIRSKDRLEALRLAFLLFIDSVIILDAAIAQVAAESLSGQTLLFRDTTLKLAEQLKMAADLSHRFNEEAVEVGVAKMDLEEMRDALQSEIDRQVSSWVHFARSTALATFGTHEKVQEALDQYLFRFGSKSTESGEEVTS